MVAADDDSGGDDFQEMNVEGDTDKKLDKMDAVDSNNCCPISLL